MEKILLIIKREYLSRVKKRTFIIMTLLGPVLLAAIAIVPTWMANVSQEARRVVVVDASKSFYGLLKSTDKVKYDYHYYQFNLSTVRKIFRDSSDVSVLYIPYNITYSNDVSLFSHKQPGINVISSIEHTLSEQIERAKLKSENLDQSIIDKVKTNIHVLNRVDNVLSDTGYNLSLGLFSATLIYIFIFLYGVQILRGVIEEKTNRIIEVIISSVKPFQLMMGKIIGVALVGLTQFALWVVLSLGIYSVAQAQFMKSEINLSKTKTEQTLKKSVPVQKTPNIVKPTQQNFTQDQFTQMTSEIFENIARTNWPLILGSFLFYFLTGYLLYSALFAAIGAAVDNDADTQQFMLPVTIPLIMAFAMTGTIVQDPSGPVAFWFSMIPLTSPIVMMVRIPFGIPAWQLGLSMLILVLSFIGATWMAGKIYRTGILMYGKKITYSELWKWLFYKE